MNEPETGPSEKLERLLTEAGYSVMPAANGQFMLPFSGEHREWLIWASATAEWTHLRVYMCDVPSIAVLRAQLDAFALETNAKTSLAKFGMVNGKVALDLDYRSEHVTEANVRDLVGMLYSIAADLYPKIFRIISGDDALESLETSLDTGANPAS